MAAEEDRLVSFGRPAGAASWRDRLVRARWSGTEFLTESHDAQFGRRLVVHEFPGTSRTLVEDFGGKSNTFKITAYFIGDDFDTKRDAFLLLLNQPVPGWLTHPWLGQLWVRPHTWSVHESNDKGGYCAIAIDWVAGGEEELAPEPDRVDVATAKITEAAAVAVAGYTPPTLSASALQRFLTAVNSRLDVLRNVMQLARLPLTWANQIQDAVAGIKADIAAIMALPGEYARALSGLAQILGLGDSGLNDTGLSDTARPKVVAILANQVAVSLAALESPALVGEAALRETQAASDLLISQLLTTSAANLALADYRVAEDRDAALASVVGAVDALLPFLAAPGDVRFEAFVLLRTTLIEALQAQDLTAATPRQVVTPLPACVLASRLGVDEAVFIARNRVRHPLFVQGWVR